MTFWETHRGALTLSGLVVVLFLAAYLVFIRSWNSEAEANQEVIAGGEERLAEFYPELKRSDAAYRLQVLHKVHAECRRRYEEHNKQIDAFKEHLRFPFKGDFAWSEVPVGLRPDEYARYLNNRYSIVKGAVEDYRRRHASSVVFESDRWLGFVPPATPEKVTREWTINELRKLCLAQRVAELAVNARVSQVLNVTPEAVDHEAARNPAYRKGGKKPEEQDEFYSNKFIVNYPVSIEMTGSLDSVMAFFNSVRQDKRFLVIRSFRVVSPEDPAADARIKGELLGRNEVYVKISAACMDFKANEAPAVKPPPTRPNAPVGPMGA